MAPFYDSVYDIFDPFAYTFDFGPDCSIGENYKLGQVFVAPHTPTGLVQLHTVLYPFAYNLDYVTTGTIDGLTLSIHKVNRFRQVGDLVWESDTYPDIESKTGDDIGVSVLVFTVPNTFYLTSGERYFAQLMASRTASTFDCIQLFTNPEEAAEGGGFLFFDEDTLAFQSFLPFSYINDFFTNLVFKMYFTSVCTFPVQTPTPTPEVQPLCLDVPYKGEKPFLGWASGAIFLCDPFNAIGSIFTAPFPTNPNNTYALASPGIVQAVAIHFRVLKGTFDEQVQGLSVSLYDLHNNASNLPGTLLYRRPVVKEILHLVKCSNVTLDTNVTVTQCVNVTKPLSIPYEEDTLDYWLSVDILDPIYLTSNSTYMAVLENSDSTTNSSGCSCECVSLYFSDSVDTNLAFLDPDDGWIGVSSLAILAMVDFAPTCLPTRTPSPTHSRSPTATPSRSPTPSRTRTSSSTRTPTPSATRTFSSTRAPTSSHTRTPSSTRTSTPSASRTFTSTRSPSSPTRTSSFTRTCTPSSTRTFTFTRSPTFSPTRTFSSTRTSTPSPSPTFTSTRSRTPSSSRSPLATVSPTSSMTPSSTSTRSTTRTSTRTGSHSATKTSTPTPTRTSTYTHRATRTPTRTPTRIPSPSATLTTKPTPTHSHTLTRTRSRSGTRRSSPTPSRAKTYLYSKWYPSEPCTNAFQCSYKIDDSALPDTLPVACNSGDWIYAVNRSEAKIWTPQYYRGGPPEYEDGAATLFCPFTDLTFDPQAETSSVTCVGDILYNRIVTLKNPSIPLRMSFWQARQAGYYVFGGSGQILDPKPGYPKHLRVQVICASFLPKAGLFSTTDIVDQNPISDSHSSSLIIMAITSGVGGAIIMLVVAGVLYHRRLRRVGPTL